MTSKRDLDVDEKVQNRPGRRAAGSLYPGLPSCFVKGLTLRKVGGTREADRLEDMGDARDSDEVGQASWYVHERWGTSAVDR